MERLKTIDELPVDEITVEGRLRDVSPDGVATLMEAIEARGFFGRIQVRRTPKGDIVMDGAHRLTAMRELGHETIPVEVYKCSDADARLIEIDGNLAGADLTLVDEAYFLAERRRTIQALRPETRQGNSGAEARWMQVNSSSLASTIAEKRGITARQVYKIMAAGDAVGPEDLALLRAAPKPVGLNDLLTIGKITDESERSHVVRSLSDGSAKSAAKARGAWAAKTKPAASEPDPVEAEARKLADGWKRARKVARRQFVAAHLEELQELIADFDDGDDE